METLLVRTALLGRELANADASGSLPGEGGADTKRCLGLLVGRNEERVCGGVLGVCEAS